MCGIAGLVVTPGCEPPRASLGEAMISVIHHRGPDDGGLHIDERAMLGMRRLSIIDVKGGHQPMYGADRQVCVVFNGEIYNFRFLRRELEALGNAFNTDGDTEVIVQAYLRWGESCFARFDGMFAIAIWDRRDGTLWLARDRFGEKPLYYSEVASQLLFGSELKSLLQSTDCPRELEPDAVRAYFTYGYVPCPLSIFRNVYKLPPAHVLRYHAGRTQLSRYWQPTFEPKSILTEAQAEDELAERLQHAVTSRLVADVPFGAFLSGGLDSSIVVALMAKTLSQPVKTFTIGFRETAFSELDDARVVARHLGCEHHELVVEPDAIDLVEKLVWHFDEPFADASAVPTFLVSQLARSHVKMVLTGDGGDELFAGYDRYLRFLAMERLGPARPLAALGLHALGGLLPAPYSARARRIGERMSLPMPERYLSGVALTRQNQARALSRYAGTARHYALPTGEWREAGSPLDRIVGIDLNSYLPDDILVKVDRMTMATSLEGRAPFLERSLAEFALRLPATMRIHAGRGKHLLRNVARRWLPASVLDKPKQGFAVPIADWFRGPLRTLMHDTLAGQALRERGLVNPDAAARLLTEHLDGRADHSEPLWQILCLELWAQRFMDEADGGPS